MLKDQDSPIGHAVRKSWRDAESRESRSALPIKSARECAKLGVVIDEDVRRSIEGYNPKSFWAQSQ